MNEYYKFLTRTEEQKKKEYEKTRKYEDGKVICKCGKRIHFAAYKDKIICSWCHREVKNTSKARFKYLILNREK